MIGSNSRWLGVVAAAVHVCLAAGCSRCGVETPPLPEVAEAPLGPDGSGSGGFAPFALPEEPEPDAPRVHTGPPAVEQFHILPVTGDWIGYRGNDKRSGVRETRAIQTPFIAWSAQVGIQGYANTPTLAGGVLYVSSQGTTWDRPDADDGVLALDPGTGRVLWRGHTDHDANGLTLASGLLLTVTDSDKLYAFDIRNGTERWVATLGCQGHQAPVVVGDFAILPRGATLVRVRMSDGQIDGELPECRGGERGGVSAEGDELFITPGAEQPWAFRGEQEEWRAIPPRADFRHYGNWVPPLITSEMIITVAHNWPWRSEIRDRPRSRPGAIARWRDNGERAWVADVLGPEGFQDNSPFSPHLRTLPWVVGGRMYWTPTNSGEIVAFDLTSGQRAEAAPLPDCRRRQFASIVGTPEMGYLARHDGVLYGFRPSPLSIAWSIQLGDHEAAGNPRTNAPVESGCSEQPVNGRALFATPAIGEDGTLFVGSGDGWMYAIVDPGWTR